MKNLFLLLISCYTVAAMLEAVDEHSINGQRGEPTSGLSMLDRLMNEPWDEYLQDTVSSTFQLWQLLVVARSNNWPPLIILDAKSKLVQRGNLKDLVTNVVNKSYSAFSAAAVSMQKIEVEMMSIPPNVTSVLDSIRTIAHSTTPLVDNKGMALHIEQMQKSVDEAARLAKLTYAPFKYIEQLLFELLDATAETAEIYHGHMKQAERNTKLSKQQDESETDYIVNEASFGQTNDKSNNAFTEELISLEIEKLTEIVENFKDVIKHIESVRDMWIKVQQSVQDISNMIDVSARDKLGSFADFSKSLVEQQDFIYVITGMRQEFEHRSNRSIEATAIAHFSRTVTKAYHSVRSSWVTPLLSAISAISYVDVQDRHIQTGDMLTEIQRQE